jgi:hypothetical protein
MAANNKSSKRDVPKSLRHGRGRAAHGSYTLRDPAFSVSRYIGLRKIAFNSLSRHRRPRLRLSKANDNYWRNQTGGE